MQDIYLKLLISTFEEIQKSDTELTIEGKKYMFREIILRKFLEDDQAYFINDQANFINDCKISLSELKDEITKYIKQIKDKKLDKHILAVNFGLRDNDLIDYGNTNLNRRVDIKSKTDDVNKRYGINYLINIPIANFTDKKICLADIEFMQASLVDNNVREPQQFVKSNSPNNLQSEKQDFEKHNEIFSNNGFVLFEYLMEKYVKPVGTTARFSEISFYYWKMYDEEKENTRYIHERPEAFKKWFFKKYNQEDIGKIKTLQELKKSKISDYREEFYEAALTWFSSCNQ